MHFIKSDNLSSASKYLLNEFLNIDPKFKKIIWFVSGGSNIAIASAVFSSLPDEILNKMTILLADERYGKPGHENSNYYQLSQAGIDFDKVNHFDVLIEKISSAEAAAYKYESYISPLFKSDTYIIGQLGIGEDGHTVGILPHSDATKPTERLVIAYKGIDYSRITVTFKTLLKFSKIIVFALGANKHEAILNLHDSSLTLDEQPAQIYKQTKNTYIINDMIGDKV